MSSSPVFPPSFDGSPWFFGWALCSRLMIMMLSAAIIVRVMSRMRAADGATDHATMCVRLSLLSLFWGFLFGSASDVITWLAWGEVGQQTMSTIMVISRVLDGASVGPFVLALYTPFWASIAIGLRITRPPTPGACCAPPGPWEPMSAPIGLSIWCVICAVGVTLTKWISWHGAHALG